MTRRRLLIRRDEVGLRVMRRLYAQAGGRDGARVERLSHYLTHARAGLKHFLRAAVL